MRFLIHTILDRSGSMGGATPQTLAGFNQFLHEQQESKEGEALFSLTLFDTPCGDPVIDHRFKAVPIKDVADLGSEGNVYFARGSTPLYDAIGESIRLSTTYIKGKAIDKVLVLIVTDGFENDSREFTREKVFDLINKKRKTGRWDFCFMGADQDAYAANSAHVGTQANATMAYAAASAAPAFAHTSSATRAYRASGGATGQSLAGFYGTGTASASVGNVTTSTPTIALDDQPATVVTVTGECPACKQPSGSHAADCSVVSWRSA